MARAVAACRPGESWGSLRSRGDIELCCFVKIPFLNRGMLSDDSS